MQISSSKRLENLSVAIVPLTKAALALLSIRLIPKYFHVHPLLTLGFSSSTWPTYSELLTYLPSMYLGNDILLHMNDILREMPITKGDGIPAVAAEMKPVFLNVCISSLLLLTLPIPRIMVGFDANTNG